MSAPTVKKLNRVRKESERGAASREYQETEAQSVKRKRASKKDKENIDESARAAEDDAMFQIRAAPAASQKVAKAAPVAHVAKPAAPKRLPVAQPTPKAPAPQGALKTGSKASVPTAASPTAKNVSAPAAPASKVDKNVPIARVAPAKDAPATKDNTTPGTTVSQGQFVVPLPAGLAGQAAPKRKRVSRAIARDLSDERRPLTVDANFAFRALVGTCFPYPSDKAKKTMFKGAWQYALQENKKPSDTLPTAGEVQIVVARLEQMRGNVKTVVRAGFARSYGFRTPIQRQYKTIKAANEALYNSLIVRDAYVYENPATRDGLYHAPLIIDTLISVWFVNRNDEGPAFAELFNPEGKGIKLETIALILAAIQNCLDEWSTGELVEISFTDRSYRKWYLHHLDRLEHYAKHKTLGPICARLRKDLYRAAMLRAGAVMPRVSSEVGITDADLDAAAASYEAGKEPSDTESESEDERPINEDSVPVLPRKRAEQLLDDSELADGTHVTAHGGDDQGNFDDLSPEARAELLDDPSADEDDDVNMLGADADVFAAEAGLFDIEDNFERTGAGGEFDEDEEEDAEEGDDEDDGEDEDEDEPLPLLKRAKLF